MLDYHTDYRKLLNLIRINWPLRPYTVFKFNKNNYFNTLTVGMK